MKGKIVYQTKPQNIQLKELNIPEKIEDDGVMLEVLQSNICGSDIHVFKGDHPLIKSGGIGHEMVGRISHLGESVDTDNAGNPVQKGDRVVPVYYATCNKCEECLNNNRHHCEQAFKYMSKVDLEPHFHGTFATHYYIHNDQYFFKVPDTVTNQEAASANCALSTVYYGLDKVELKPGYTIVIQGAGGLGLNACAIAKEKGAQVIIIDGVASRLEMAMRFGADETINMNDYSTVEKRQKRIEELTNGKGADVGLEVTGVPSAIDEGIHLVKENGQYLIMGNITVGKKAEFDPGLLVRKSIQVIPVNRYNPEYLYYSLLFIERNREKYPFSDLLDATFTLEEVELALDKSVNHEVGRATIVVNN